MKRIVLANPIRTAIGSFGGSLSGVSAPELGAQVIMAALNDDAKLKSIVSEVYMGNVLQAAVGQNPARQAAIKAGIPDFVPASTINTVCGSGLHTVGLAYNAIFAGQADLIVAGGMENMSLTPYVLKSARNGYKMGNGEIIDSMVADGLTCPFNNYHMGITAENIANEYRISRQEQDEFAALSQEKAAKARREGVFSSEIVPVKIKVKREEVLFKEDEYIREGSTAEKLAGLKPAFKADGTVTAGNSSGVNDGAAAVLVASENKALELGLSVKAVVRGFSIIGLRPEIMGMGPVYAISKLLKEQNIGIADIDLFELNEAFAVQSVACVKQLGIDSEKVNIFGGAISLGHPIGASGTRILVTLLNALERSDKRLGIASLCVGTGMGVALLVERIG